MTKLIKEETITQEVTSQIIYKEARIDLKHISNKKNYAYGLFRNNPKNDDLHTYYNKYKCVEGGVNEFRIHMLIEGLVAKNDWYIDYIQDGYRNDPIKVVLTRFKQNNGPFIMKSKLVGINKEGYENLPFITNDQVSKIVKMYNDLKKDEKISTFAVPMKLVIINGKLISETIIPNEDGSFPFLTMKEYADAKELEESEEV